MDSGSFERAGITTVYALWETDQATNLWTRKLI